MYVDNKADFVGKSRQLRKGCAHDICRFHYNCSCIFWEKELISWRLSYTNVFSLRAALSTSRAGRDTDHRILEG